MRMIHALVAFLMLAASAAVPAQQLPAQSPEAFVEGIVEDVLTNVEARRTELKSQPEKLRALVIDGILPHVDFPYVSQLVLGKHWRTAEPAQRQRFMDEFQRLLLRTYADALLAYDDQEIRYLPSRRDESRRDARVRTQVVPRGQNPIAVNYRLYRTDAGEWKVFDVVVEGVSLVTSYRDTFAREIEQDGLDSLIANLKNHEPPAALQDVVS